LGLEVNGGEKRVLLKGERQKVQAKSAEGAVALKLGGKVEVQLLLPSSFLSSSSSGQQPLSLSTLLQDAKEWCREARRGTFTPSSSSSSSSSSFLHTYQTQQMNAYYSWLASLGTVVWEEGNVALSPQVQEEEHEGGKVYLAHLLFPVGTGALYVAGHRVRHPGFLRRHKAEVVAEDEVMMLR